MDTDGVDVDLDVAFRGVAGHGHLGRIGLDLQVSRGFVTADRDVRPSSRPGECPEGVAAPALSEPGVSFSTQRAPIVQPSGRVPTGYVRSPTALRASASDRNARMTMTLPSLTCHT
jgi:hypothetical protein